MRLWARRPPEVTVRVRRGAQQPEDRRRRAVRGVPRRPRVPYVYEPPWRDLFGVTTEANPDYLVGPDGAGAICEVKQFETTRIRDRFSRGNRAGVLSPQEVFGAVRWAMSNTAREQLLPFAGLDVPLVIVLANPLGADVHLDQEHVALAIMGNPKFSIAVGPGAPPNDPGQYIAEHYGAFISVRIGEVVNHHPHVSGVVVVHERENRQDWVGRVIADEPDAEEFEGLGAAMNHYLRAVKQREDAGEAPEGSYRWVEVFDLSSNPTPPGFQGTPLRRHLFDGERDRWFGFVCDTFDEIT
jgi:hypothetical protein